MNTASQRPPAFSTKPSPMISDALRSSKPEDTRLHPLSDVTLHRAYKTVGMRSVDTRCFNCLEENDSLHRRNWMCCGGLCPACPVDQQHWGGLCPRLCMLRKESFWMERADLAFADGFERPTPGLGIAGWKRLGLWKGGASGEESPQSALHLSNASSVSSNSTTPSTPPLSSLSLVSSPAMSFESPLTLVLQSAEAASTTSSKPTELAPKLTLSASSELIPPSTPAPSGSRIPLTPKERGRMAVSSRPEKRTRSRSSSKDCNERIYRERNAPRHAPVSVRMPAGRPSLSSLFSDPIFKSVIADEAAAMASANFSQQNPQQHAAIDGVLVAVLRAARIKQRLGAKNWEYQPSEPMKAYLDYFYKHFPILMSRGNPGHHISSLHQKGPNPGIDTYYGQAWRGAWMQEEGAWAGWKLSESNQDLIEGRWMPRTQSEKMTDYKRYGNAASESGTLGTIHRFRCRDDPPPVPSRLPYGSPSMAKPTAPVLELATSVPRGPRLQSKTWLGYKITRGPARCPWESPKTTRSKQTQAKAPSSAPLPPPPFAKEGTEKGEVVELVKSTPGEPIDIMSCLEMQLRGSIAEEDWEDLLKGDV
ncbi:hypothetical protein P171DRAFT_426357 [Karstenula rhodostoma CBS 690.94]|uniref:Uncharacterized protein n=1 Tax=Karstenula rhodostoma CBS 690.94 TaxID=1392251 RepID=A0A9P4PV36_9PLEO|nr:hypothetical protein P171DRAFT_426357 [Karstenula rhodostoma CBS 690.94]